MRILMEWGKIERDHAVASYDSTWKVFSPDGNIPPDVLRMVLEQAKAELKLTRDLSLSEIIDLAAASGGATRAGDQKTLRGS